MSTPAANLRFEPCPPITAEDEHKLAVIEDSRQAPGSLYKRRRAGTMGRYSAFSLNQNKNFCGGEGGLFVSDNEEVFVKGRALRAAA